jgi:hypothetical protein
MNREQVQSSMITSVGYDAQTAILEIEFRNGRTYRYFDVPEFLYRGFVLAASKGQYFSRRIDSRFRFEEVR